MVVGVRMALRVMRTVEPKIDKKTNIYIYLVVFGCVCVFFDYLEADDDENE